MINLVTVKCIYDFLDKIAPFEYAMDFDNCGILVGDKNRFVKRVILALDITTDVVYEAQKMNAELIISHHPVIQYSDFFTVQIRNKCNMCTY